MQIIKGEPRRRWSREEKLAAALQPGVRLTDVARAIGANPSMVWAWRKALRAELEGATQSAVTFAPVAMIEEPPRQGPPVCDGAIRVEFGPAIRMHVPAAAPDVLARIAETPIQRLDQLLPWNWRASDQAVAA